MPSELNACAAMTPAKAEIAPTERSKPPAMNTKRAAAAMIPTGADWNEKFFRFCAVKNTGLASERMTNSATKATTMP